MGERTAKIKDVVWLNTRAKLDGLIELGRSADEGMLLVISHFRDTARQLAAAFDALGIPCCLLDGHERQEHITGEQKVVLLLSERTSRDLARPEKLPSSVKFCVSERYPLPEREQELSAFLCREFGIETLEIHSSLDDPLLKYYGGPHLQSLFTTMGMAAEPVEGELMTRTIDKAQKKLRKKVKLERRSDSAAEWYQWNIENSSS